MREQLRLDLDRLEAVAGGDSDLPRGRLVRNGLVALGGILIGTAAALGTGRPAGAARSQRQDRKILQFLLQLEYLQADFYAAALDAGQLDGELREFAQVVGRHEERHVALLERLGAATGERPTFDFGDAITDPARFSRTARQLEELGVAAYVGQGANLSPRAVVPIARVTSVEARHAAWITDLVGQDPAPRAADAGKSAGEVTAEIRRTGFVA